MHLEVYPSIAYHLKPQPLVETARRVAVFHMHRHAHASRARLIEQIVEYCSAEASSAKRGQQRDVDDAKFACGAGYIQPAAGRTVRENDVEAGIGVVLGVMHVLRLCL